jgi:hypothetical protein
MSSSSIFVGGARAQAVLIGAVLGLSAALPMYLWQSSAQVALAAFVIAGYTAWLWAATQRVAMEHAHLRDSLRRLSVNQPGPRIVRLVRDAGFWWSVVFGCSTVTGGVWYAGLRDAELLGAIGAMWGLIAVCMNYSLTLLHPTTRCRRCRYQLVAHLDPGDPHQRIICPECGAEWSKQQLCLVGGGGAARDGRSIRRREAGARRAAGRGRGRRPLAPASPRS